MLIFLVLLLFFFFFYLQPLSLLAVSVSFSHYLTTFLISMHLQLFHQFHKYEMGGRERLELLQKVQNDSVSLNSVAESN